MKRLQQYLKKRKIQLALFFSSDPNYVYFTQSDAGGVLAVPATGSPRIITNTMEAERLQCHSNIPCWVRKPGVRTSEILKKKYPSVTRVGINEGELSIGALKQLRKGFRATYVDVGGFCDGLRELKSPEEIEFISRAARLNDALFSAVIRTRKPKTELELAGFIEAKMRELGVLNSFDTIVATGKNASMPHHPPTKAKLRGFTVVDLGVKYKNYNSDSTRTLFFGKPTKRELNLYELVVNALDKLVKAVRPGVKPKELIRLEKQLLKPHSKHILHALGHGIGVSVHELPGISGSYEDSLKPGMVLCLEPGLYFKGRFGIRVEDMVLVTADGSRLLTRAPRKLSLKPGI